MNASRQMPHGWPRHFGVPTDQSQGAMDTPFSTGHCTGRAVADRSETLFGRTADPC